MRRCHYDALEPLKSCVIILSTNFLRRSLHGDADKLLEVVTPSRVVRGPSLRLGCPTFLPGFPFTCSVPREWFGSSFIFIELRMVPIFSRSGGH
jgi:hypothetical protein